MAKYKCYYLTLAEETKSIVIEADSKKEAEKQFNKYNDGLSVLLEIVEYN